MASENQYYTIDYSGKLVTVCEPMILKPGDFTVLQNVRYVPNGYGGTTLRGIAGITKINAVAPTTYTNFKAGIHYRKDQPSESHLLVQALDGAGTAGRILDNTTAITGSETGAFSSTALYTLTNVATGRFNSLPDNSVGFANGYDCCVWGGDEYRVGRAMNVDYVDDTFQLDGTEFVTNNLTTEYMSIKSVASEATGSVSAKLLLHGNATPLVDSGATTHTVTATGAAYSTAQKKFGAGSILFDGSNDKLDVAAHADFNVSDGTWCVDCWFRPVAWQDITLCSIVNDANNYIQCNVEFYAGGLFYATMNLVVGGVEKLGSGAGLLSTTQVPSSAWSHLAFVENGNTFYIFLNGALVATQGSVTDRMPDANASVVVGADKAGTGRFTNGYIDELAFWQTAKYTATFTPPAIEYGGTTYTTLASLYIASPRALSGAKMYVGTANDQTSELYDVKEWDGSAWVSCSTVTDGTAAGGISLAQTGSITWDSTVTTSKPRMLYNTHAYWYLIQFVGLNNSTYPTVYYITTKAPFQPFTDIFDGVMKKPSMVWRETTDFEYKDKTTELLEVDWVSGDGPTTAMKMGSFGTSDAFYVGSPFRLQGINVYFVNEGETTQYENTTATVLTVSYWGGSAWVACSGVIDGTKGGDADNVSFHHGGTISWSPPALPSEFKRTISNEFPFYYYKFNFSAALDSVVWVDQIQVLPAAKDLRPAKFVFPWQNKTVLINEYSGYQDKVIVSIPYSTSTFNGENSFESRVDDSLMAGTAVHTRYDNSNLEDAILCSKTKTYLMSGSSVKDTRIVKISDVYGCINPNTMRTCTLTTENGRREVAIWLSQVGIVMYDGTSIKRIDDDIRDKWTPNHANVISYANLLTMYADFDERHNEYWLMTASSTGWIYNVEFNKWWYFAEAPATGNIQGCFPVYSTAGHQYMLAFSSAGFLLRLNNGVSRDGGTIVRTITNGDFPLLKRADALFKRTRPTFVTTYLKADASADSATLTHYGDGSTTGTELATFTQTNTGYAYKELRTTAGNVLDTDHILHKFSLSLTADDTAIGLEPLLTTIRYREAEIKQE